MAQDTSATPGSTWNDRVVHGVHEVPGVGPIDTYYLVEAYYEEGEEVPTSFCNEAWAALTNLWLEHIYDRRAVDLRGQGRGVRRGRCGGKRGVRAMTAPFHDLRRDFGWRTRAWARWFRIKYWVLVWLGRCQHPGSVGPAGGEVGFCLYCNREVLWES